MNEGKITFANIVATPTQSFWSQAYTAGKLYAVLSLEHSSHDSSKLAAIGKEIVNALVEEYFTLEIKDLATVKAAIVQTTTKIPKDTTACLVVISIVNNILYAFSFGGGTVMLKRDGKVGAVLAGSESDTTVAAVSGFLKEKDTVILQTKHFAEIVTEDDLLSFSTPADAVEVLSPKIHGAQHGGASAIVLSYQEAPTLAFANDAFAQDEKETEELPPPSPLEDEVAHREVTKQKFSFPKVHISFPRIFRQLPKKTLLFLLIPLILLGLLAFSIITTQQRKENEKIQALYTSIYPPAEKKYNEGQALLSLNKTLAQEDFKKAQEILSSNISKFPKDSPEYKKLAALLEKVNSVTEESTSGTALTAEKAATDDSALLAALLKDKEAQYALQTETDIYLGSNTGVKTAEGKTVIANEDGWEQIGGIGTFGTNVYILDTKGNQILKYVSGNADSKSVYAQDSSFAKATGMAIDGSVYVLTTDGSIKKYTKGKPDSFSITGLETPLKTPIRIYTNPDINNLYILDKGNSRVVVLNKAGEFQNAYAATVLQNAKDFDVTEADKKIYILSSGSVYVLPLP